MKHILIVDDDKNIRSKLAEDLACYGYKIQSAEAADQAVDLIKASESTSQPFDIVIMDCLFNAGESTGAEAVSRIRIAGYKTPIIFLSVLAAEKNKVAALNSGGDDFIVKPFNILELKARLEAVVRRCKGHASSIFKLGNMRLDFYKEACYINGKRIKLTNKEYGMLELMCHYGKGFVVSKERFIHHLYYTNPPSESKIIDVFVCKLRAKIASYNNGVHYISTVWGKGYTISEQNDDQLPSDFGDGIYSGSHNINMGGYINNQNKMNENHHYHKDNATKPIFNNHLLEEDEV